LHGIALHAVTEFPRYAGFAEVVALKANAPAALPGHFEKNLRALGCA
jgi:hypothetical protein